MASVRAKFRCVSREETTLNQGQVNYRFQAMYDADLPEDQRYAKYTPVGELKISVDNPAVNFKVGESYYLDFTEVPAS